MLNSVQNSSYLSALDVFKNLSIDDLKSAVNDDSQFTAYVSADAFNFSSFDDEKNSILNENKILAEENLKSKPELDSLKNEIVSLSSRIESYDIDAKLAEIKSLLGYDLTSDSILKHLQSIASEAEVESDEIFEKFLKQEIDFDTFNDLFMKKRHLMYLRKIKAEKISDLLRNTSAATNPFAVNPNHFGYGYGYGNGSGHRNSDSHLPYPVNDVSMPMPSMFP